MLGVGKSFMCILSVVIIINSGLVASQVQLTLPYNEAKVTGRLDSSVTFTWRFTGELLIADWGTKQTGLLVIDQRLFTLDSNGPQTYNVSQYNGRVSGTWNGKSPGQVTFTLMPIKEVDNRIFIFKFLPQDISYKAVYDTVQLSVRGAPEATVTSPVLSIVVGVTASFICNATGFPLPNVIWMRQNGFEIDASDVNIQIYSHPGSSQLVIQNTSVSDQGYYICKASNYKSAMARAFLGVISLYLDYARCPTSIDAKIGEPITMCCPVQGSPPPDVNWELPNGTLLRTKSTDLHLTIKTKDDFGCYKCNATGLENTFLDFVVTVQKKHNVSIDVGTGPKVNLITWTEVENATEYLVRVFVKDYKDPIILVGKRKTTTMEIPHSTLRAETSKSLPAPVTVNVTILAIRENEVVAIETLLNIEISGASTPGLNFISVIVLLVVTLSI